MLTLHCADDARLHPSVTAGLSRQSTERGAIMFSLLRIWDRVIVILADGSRSCDGCGVLSPQPEAVAGDMFRSDFECAKRPSHPGDM